MFGGYPPTAIGYPPTAIGYTPTAIGYPPTAIGYPPTAIGYPPTAIGYPPTAIGYPPTAIGYPPTAIGYTPTAIGYTPTAIGYPPTAIGYLPAAIVGRIGHSEFFFSLRHPLMLTMDTQTVVLWGPVDPSTECADIDLRQQLVKHLVARPITFRSVPSHRHLSEARDEDELETIRRKNGVDQWAKTATAPQCPRVNQQTPQQLSYAEGLHPNLQNKWIAVPQRGGAAYGATFGNNHSGNMKFVSALPLSLLEYCAVQRMLEAVPGDLQLQVHWYSVQGHVDLAFNLDSWE